MGAAVVCCGNVLMGDDGIGPALAEGLRAALPGDVDFFVAENDPFAVADIVERYGTVFVVDALRAAGFPDGKVLVQRILPDFCCPPPDAHSFGVVDSVALLEPSVLEKGRLFLVGISVSDIVPRAGLSERMAGMQEAILSEVRGEIVKYLKGGGL